MSIYSFLRYTTMGRGGIEKVLNYLEDYLPAIFSHPDKTMEDCDMLSFLHGVLQVYLEFQNSSSPFEKYVPDFTKPSRCVQDECAHMITEIVSLFNHIRSCQYLPTSTQLKEWITYRNWTWTWLQFWMSTSIQMYWCQMHRRIRNTYAVLCIVSWKFQTD